MSQNDEKNIMTHSFVIFQGGIPHGFVFIFGCHSFSLSFHFISTSVSFSLSFDANDKIPCHFLYHLCVIVFHFLVSFVFHFFILVCDCVSFLYVIQQNPT